MNEALAPHNLPEDDLPVDSEEEEKFWELGEQFQRQIRKEELWKSWWKRFGEDPTKLFSDQQLQTLESEDPVNRTALFAASVAHMTVTSEMIKKYFTKFPQDQKLLSHALRGAEGDFFYNSNVIRFVAAIWPHLPDIAYIENDPRIGQFRFSQISELRKLASQALLSGYEYIHANRKKLNGFGPAVKPYHDISEEAAKMAPIGGDRPLNTREMFNGEAYQNLSFERKSAMLRACLGDCQYSLVYEEVFQKFFTKESVERRNKRQGYDPAHSMLLRSVQSLSAYNLSTSYFESTMRRTADIGGAVEEYGTPKVTLAVLREFQNVKAAADINTDLIVEFWLKNRDPLFGNAVADALSSQNPRRAAAKLLEAIPTDAWNPEALAAILYRLELGQIGISKKGAQYLGRLYDLGEFNNPDFFVNRLTARGDMGVFNEKRALVGYFNLGDLTSPEVKSKAAVLQLSYDMLFAKREAANSDEELQRDALLKEFSEHYFVFYNDQLFQKTGIRFNNLDWREQGWFLHFMHRADPSLQDRAAELVRQYGENGLRTFLSIEYDRNMGEKILEFTEAVQDRTLVDSIFARYAAMVSVANGSDELTRGVAERMGKSARDILEKAHQSKNDPAKLKHMLEQVSVKGQMMLAMYRYLKERGEAKTISDLDGVQYETVAGAELVSRAVELADCNALYKKNWPDAGEALVEDFEKNLTKAGGYVRRVHYQGKLIAFMLVTPVGENTVYLSALNADPEFATTNAGMLLFADVLREEVLEKGNIATFEALPKRFDQYRRHFQDAYAVERIGEPFVDPKDQQMTFKAEVRPLARRTQ